MHLLAFILILTTLMTETLSQTPLGTLPSTNKTLSVEYGSTQVTPGIQLPQTLVSKFPTITNLPPTLNQTYTLLLLDLSVSTASLNTSALVPGIQVPVTPGISANRTTRLHYWQTGLTFSANGSLVNNTTPIAFYQPPSPPSGDIAHTFVFYLFEQGTGFMPPPAGNPFSQALVNQGMNRISFNLNHLTGEQGIGNLVGANYFLVANTTGAAKATGSVTGSTLMPTSVSFTGGAGRLGLGLAGGMVIAVGFGLSRLLY